VLGDNTAKPLGQAENTARIMQKIDNKAIVAGACRAAVDNSNNVRIY